MNWTRRPDVARGLFVKKLTIALKGVFVPGAEFGGFVSAAFSGFVVERALKNVAAEILPVRTGVNEMQVPDLIDIFGR